MSAGCSLVAYNAPFEEGSIAVDRHYSDAPQFLSFVEPEVFRLADHASFPSQIPASVPLRRTFPQAPS